MKRNPVLLEVFKNRYASIAEEMGVSLNRTAFSPNIKERRDFSCAVFDGRGQMVAQAAHIPVHLGSMPLSVAAALEHFRFAEGDMVVATVSDTGKGMPPQIQEKIFAPFFTTKKMGKGTGLGLSISCNLIKAFEGSISVESTLDVGTCFRIVFPASKHRAS